jgi:phosphoglycerol transferase MdoB-like AlkP superfamily enzyme
MAFLLRVVETIHVFVKFNPKHLIISELFGFMKDVYQVGLIMIILYPVYHFLHKKWPFYSKMLTWFIIGSFVFMHITISEYFFYQLIPLDIFVFKHPLDEMAFSLNTAGFDIFFIPLLKYIFILLAFLILCIVAEKKEFKQSWRKPLAYAYLGISITFLILYFFIKLPVSTKLSVNKSTFIYSSIFKNWYQNQFGPDKLKMSEHFQEEFPDRKYINKEYPFLHEFETRDKLSGYLAPHTQAPNLIIFIVEGLANDFLHPVKGIHFMPFLDSLSKKSLYWDRFFSNCERSFNVTPSLIGSLPFGENGFAFLDQYPYHFSLVNVFKKNNFYTSFYYGQGAWFHGKEPFYKFNNIDQIVDRNDFNSSLDKVFIGEENHFWGYNDFDLFKQYFITTDSIKKEKRLDIFFTGTTHAPFSLKNPNYYHLKLDKQIEVLTSSEDKEHFEKFRTYYTALYNVDDAMRYFFNEYSKRPEFANTVFLITGDHPMTEIPAESSIKKYHVPLIIYSPTIKIPEKFHGISSHLDIYETILSYYQNAYQFDVPPVSTALGSGISFSTQFENDHVVPIMNDNRQINDFFYNGYFVADDNTLFKVIDNLTINEYYDIKNWKRIYNKLKCFRAASLNAGSYKKLMPEKYYFDFFNYEIHDEMVKKEKFKLGATSLNLIKDVRLYDNQIYLDLEFRRWEHLDFTPQCLIRIYKEEGVLEKELVYEIKSGETECQVHIPVPMKLCNPGECFIKAVLKNKESHSYTISDLKVKVYSSTSSLSGKTK